MSAEIQTVAPAARPWFLSPAHSRWWTEQFRPTAMTQLGCVKVSSSASERGCFLVPPGRSPALNNRAGDGAALPTLP